MPFSYHPDAHFIAAPTVALKRDGRPVRPDRYPCLALSNEVEVDLQPDGVGNTEQDGNARLLHLDVVERERRRG